VDPRIGPERARFRVDRPMVLANFAYAKLAMVPDLDGALDELAELTLGGHSADAAARMTAEISPS
jgi:hypothetical protein